MKISVHQIAYAIKHMAFVRNTFPVAKRRGKVALDWFRSLDDKQQSEVIHATIELARFAEDVTDNCLDVSVSVNITADEQR